MGRYVTSIGGLVASTLLTGAAWAQAQVRPPPVDAGKAAQEARPPVPAEPKQAPAPAIVQQPDRPLALPAGDTLHVDAFRFEGADGVADAALQAAVARYRGRALTMAEIEAAAAQVTALYRARGYLVARAWVPQQDARAGTLTLRIVVGRYGRVAVANRSLVADRRIDAYFADLAGNRPVTRDALERDMLLVGDLPGAMLPQVSVAPGSAAGTSDFTIEVAPGERVGGYLVADDYGARYTGRQRVSAGVSVNSPLALGDRLDVSGMGSAGADLLSGRVAWSTPLGATGLRAELAASRTTYQLGDLYAPLDALGRSDAVEATFSLPLRRTRTHTLVATLALADRKLRDEIRSAGQVTTKQAHAATFGLAYDRFGPWRGHDGYVSVAASATWGRLGIDEPDMAAANRAGAATLGSYAKANLTLTGRLALSDRVDLQASIEGQRALRRNLDSSEQLLVSGSRGVLAYENAASGDDGLLLHAELRRTLPDVGRATHGLSVFTDLARIRLHDAAYATAPGASDATHLKDAGIAYNLSWRAFFARAQVAHAVGRWPGSMPDARRTRLLFQLGATL